METKAPSTLKRAQQKRRLYIDPNWRSDKKIEADDTQNKSGTEKVLRGGMSQTDVIGVILQNAMAQTNAGSPATVVSSKTEMHTYTTVFREG